MVFLISRSTAQDTTRCFFFDVGASTTVVSAHSLRFFVLVVDFFFDDDEIFGLSGDEENSIFLDKRTVPLSEELELVVD